MVGLLALFAVAVGGTAYFSLLAGANRALASFRASWFLRAGMTAMSARRSLDGFYPAGVEPELRSYVQWAEQLPKVYTPAK